MPCMVRINKVQYVCCTLTNLDWIGQRDGDGQREAFRHGHHQHCHTDDKEFDHVLHVDGQTMFVPRNSLEPVDVDQEASDEDENG